VYLLHGREAQPRRSDPSYLGVSCASIDFHIISLHAIPRSINTNDNNNTKADQTRADQSSNTLPD